MNNAIRLAKILLNKTRAQSTSEVHTASREVMNAILHYLKALGYELNQQETNEICTIFIEYFIDFERLTNKKRL